jgi:hypothetical protein
LSSDNSAALLCFVQQLGGFVVKRLGSLAEFVYVFDQALGVKKFILFLSGSKGGSRVLRFVPK